MLGSAYKADPQAKPERTQKVYMWDVDIKYQCHMYDTLIQRFQAGIECTEAKVQYQSPQDNYWCLRRSDTEWKLTYLYCMTVIMYIYMTLIAVGAKFISHTMVEILVGLWQLRLFWIIDLKCNETFIPHAWTYYL